MRYRWKFLGENLGGPVLSLFTLSSIPPPLKPHTINRIDLLLPDGTKYYKIKSLEEETVSVLEEAGYSFFSFCEWLPCYPTSVKDRKDLIHSIISMTKKNFG